jgi:hypothetical protein
VIFGIETDVTAGERQIYVFRIQQLVIGERPAIVGRKIRAVYIYMALRDLDLEMIQRTSAHFGATIAVVERRREL